MKKYTKNNHQRVYIQLWIDHEVIDKLIFVDHMVTGGTKKRKADQ